jgi:serpin B
VIDDTGDFLVMVLANAIYFKGDWRDRFDRARTAPRPFTLETGEVVQVPTMHREGSQRLGRLPNALVAELPYGGNAFVMTILLPDPGVDVDTFAESLSPALWREAVDHLIERNSEIYLPKFTMEWADSLERALQRLGMRDAFQSGVADFTPLSASRGRALYVQFVTWRRSSRR